MYSQMACHAYYGVSTAVGGNSWSFEAWLKDVDWSVALAPWNACQWDTLDANDEAINGLVSAVQGKQIRSSLEEDNHFETWTVKDRTRRRVTSFEAYDCLVAKGNPAQLYPGEFIKDYIDSRGSPMSAARRPAGRPPCRARPR
jgi:hypothetical protein